MTVGERIDKRVTEYVAMYQRFLDPEYAFLATDNRTQAERARQLTLHDLALEQFVADEVYRLVKEQIGGGTPPDTA